MSKLPFAHPGTPHILAWPEGFDPCQQKAAGGSKQQHEETLEQWIDQVINYSSQYGSGNGPAWTAQQVIGPPRVRNYGDNSLAWAPAEIGSVSEFLEVQVARYCRVQCVRIHESLCGGAFRELQLWNPTRQEYVTVVHRPHTRCGRYPNQIRIEEISVPQEEDNTPMLSFETNRLRLEFDQRGGTTWYEVDAIQVIGITSTKHDDEVQGQAATLSASIASDIASLKFDKSTADCTLLVAGEGKEIDDNKTENARIPVHRGILAARCPLFRAMLDNGELPCGGEKVLRGVELTLVKQIMEWIYTGTILETDERFDIRRDCIALAVAADYFQLQDLIKHCQGVFANEVLAMDNAALLFGHFDHLVTTGGCGLCMEVFRGSALRYCGNNFLEISQTQGFQELSQPQSLEVIERYRLESLQKETRKVRVATTSSMSSVANNYDNDGDFSTNDDEDDEDEEDLGE